MWNGFGRGTFSLVPHIKYVLLNFVNTITLRGERHFAIQLLSAYTHSLTSKMNFFRKFTYVWCFFSSLLYLSFVCLFVVNAIDCSIAAKARAKPLAFCVLEMNHIANRIQNFNDIITFGVNMCVYVLSRECTRSCSYILLWP